MGNGVDAMATTDTMVEQFEKLPPEKQLEVIDFIEFLAERARTKQPYPSLCGLWANLGFDITEEDIREARKEMWGNFPREDI